MKPVRIDIIRRPRTPGPRLARVTRIGPPRVNALAVTQQAAGFYRVADPTLARYELYIGVDASPNFAAAPAQTSATLPMSSAALATGHVHHLVLRRRNQWGLLSQNVGETLFDLTAGAALSPTPPSGPQSVSVAAAASDKIQVSAEYMPSLDGANAADTWLVFATSDGSTPNPASTPTLTARVVNADGVARLSTQLGPFTDGATVKVLVRTRRSGSPNVDSANTTPLSAVAAAAGPAAPIGVASLGQVAE